MSKALCRALFTGFALSLQASVWATEPVYLGVLEEWHRHYETETNPTPYVVRVAFKHDANGWAPMPSEANDHQSLVKLLDHFPKAVEWTIAFDGRDLGHFSSRRPDTWESYSDVGHFQPDPKASIQLVSEGADSFHYWLGSPSFRPLVTVSAPNVKDPGSWKPWHPSRAELTSFFPAFHKTVGTIPFTCKGPPTDEYPDSYIVVEKAYRSTKGDWLVGLQIDPAQLKCERDMAEKYEEDHWFLKHNEKVNFVGESMTLIDAGDYDNDGSSEVLFHHSGYNNDGYILLFDRLQRQAQFDWGYH